MLTIVGCPGKANLLEIKPQNLLLDQMYFTAEARRNDDGEDMIHYDCCYVFTDMVPGQTKKVKIVKFTKEARTKRLSEIPGVYFFGPISVRPYENPKPSDDDDSDVEETTEDTDATSSDNES